ncbi:MAG: WecB/TagA/CpsF family glycosyltransferase [Leptolyngbyaceae cyanobacterium MO_188.B28]|nr:WecB/TagA/CpsF family glycosyltransferase [Leptolyngbyaceae cyanobacterium MO_188.B28]
MDRVNLLNVRIDNLSKTELLARLDPARGGVVFTPNVDHLMKLHKDRDFSESYQSADYIVCDSQILVYASRFLGTPIQEKIPGSDLFPAFYQHYKNESRVKIFLLGGPPNAAQKARQRINQKVNREIVVGSYCPPFGFESDEQECEKIIDLINQSGATVLAVGVGAPKQEKWILKYKHRFTQIKVFLAVGATINFEAGILGRAPKWMRETGLEWLYRLCCEPKRLWKRYLLDASPFVCLIMLQKLREVRKRVEKVLAAQFEIIT